MKLKLPVLFLMFNLFSGYVSAQQLDFDLQVSLDQSAFASKRKEIPAKIVITNRSEDVLETSKLKYVSFYLSKCLIESCGGRGETFSSGAKIEAASLKKGESLEFEVNLSDLYWQDSISSWTDMKRPKNLAKVPFSNDVFYADIKVFDEYYEAKDAAMKIPLHKSYQSNKIILSLKASK